MLTKNSFRFYFDRNQYIDLLLCPTWMVARVSLIGLTILTTVTLTYCHKSVYPLMPLTYSGSTLEFELGIPKTHIL